MGGPSTCAWQTSIIKIDISNSNERRCQHPFLLRSIEDSTSFSPASHPQKQLLTIGLIPKQQPKINGSIRPIQKRKTKLNNQSTD